VKTAGKVRKEVRLPRRRGSAFFQFHGSNSSIGQPGEHVGEPGARIDVVELGGLDQGVDRRDAVSSQPQRLLPESS